MASLKLFVVIWFGVIFSVTVFLVGFMPKIVDEGEVSSTSANHFSVVWRGFIPDYDPSYPDYYICINDLVASSLTMNIRLFIQNQEASGYYFKVSAHTTPPSGWAVPDYFVGYIGVDGTKDFVYQMERTKPNSIPQGRTTESISLRISAYYDIGYSNLYSYDNFTVRFHFIDRTSSAWTILSYNDFDDGTVQGWGGGSVSTTYYRSFRYSLYCTQRNYSPYTATATKSCHVGAGYSEGYMIFAVRFTQTTADYPRIYIDGTLYFKADVTPSPNIWYQFVVPLHLGTNVVTIENYGNMYIDDAFVIAK